MQGRRWLVTTGLWLALVAAGCGPGPAPSPPPTIDRALPEWRWAEVELPRIPGGFLNGVAASELGFVAVGVASGAAWSRAMLLRSADGVTWTAPDIDLDGVGGAGVAAGPDGFLVSGYRVLTATTARAVLFRSADGARWEEVPLAMEGQIGIFGAWWAGDRWIIPGQEVSGQTVAWFELQSPDGIAWTRQAVDSLRLHVQSAAGWRGIDGSGRWTRFDGAPLEAPRLPEAANGNRALWAPRGVALASGTLLVGSVETRCGLFQQCGMESAAWWSADGETFGAIPGGAPGWTFGDANLAGADGLAFVEEDGFVSVSADGWRWSPLVGAPAPGTDVGPGWWTSVNAAAATPDRLVLVGGRSEPGVGGAPDTELPWAAVAMP
jgi:hypothetical protein